MGFLDLLFPPYNYVANKSTLLFKKYCKILTVSKGLFNLRNCRPDLLLIQSPLH